MALHISSKKREAVDSAGPYGGWSSQPSIARLSETSLPWTGEIFIVLRMVERPPATGITITTYRHIGLSLGSWSVLGFRVPRGSRGSRLGTRDPSPEVRDPSTDPLLKISGYIYILKPF